MTLSERFATPLIVVSTGAAAMFTVLLAGGSGWFDFGVFRLIYDGMALVAIVPWLLVAAFRRDWLPASRLAPAIAACLAAFAIATITSRAPRLSVEMLGYAILLGELYLLLVALMRRPRLRAHFERLVIGLGLLVCVLYLLQVLQAWQLWWGVVGHLTVPPLRPGYLGLSLSPNPIATLVLLLGAFALATGRLRGRAGRAVAAVLLVLVAVTAVITGSRGAWIGAGAGLAVCGLVAVIAAPATRSRALAFLRTRRGAAALVVGLAALVAAGALAASSGRLTLDDGGYREAFAAVSLRMFQSSPLVGIGPGVWQVLRASYTTALQPDLYIPHAHNIYLQTLAEFGVAGVLAGLILVGSLAALVFGAIRSPDEARRRVGVAALFAVVLLAGQQLVDMLMNVPALLLAMVFPMAWLDATARGRAPEPDPAGSRPREQARGGRARLLVFGMLALTLVIAAGLLRIEGIASGAEKGVLAADAGRWTDAMRPALDAVASDPGVNFYSFQAGVAAANAGDLATAADALGRSAAADDYTIAWLDLAAVRWQLGDATGARVALARAERLGLQRMSVAVAAGWLRWHLGDRAAAISDYGAAIVAGPTLANDPFWRSDPELSAARPAIMDAARQQIEGGPGGAAAHAPMLFTLQLLGGDVAAAEVELAPLSATDRAFYEQVSAAWQGVPGSQAVLQQLAERHPLDSTPVGWCQLVAARNNEQDLVARYGTWLWLGGGGLPGGPPVARVELGQPLPQLPGGLDQYRSLYRRPVPDAQVIGILPQINFQGHF
jgi:O-antigen ligase